MINYQKAKAHLLKIGFKDESQFLEMKFTRGDERITQSSFKSLTWHYWKGNDLLATYSVTKKILELT